MLALALGLLSAVLAWYVYLYRASAHFWRERALLLEELLDAHRLAYPHETHPTRLF